LDIKNQKLMFTKKYKRMKGKQIDVLEGDKVESIRNKKRKSKIG